MQFRIIKKRLDIGRQFDVFLDKVSESGLLFKAGVEAYLSGNIESFEKKIEDIIETEHDGDALRRDLEETLYVQTLIPESRGDVLELLENMDALLDRFKGALWKFNIERPQLTRELHDDFKELTSIVFIFFTRSGSLSATSWFAHNSSGPCFQFPGYCRCCHRSGVAQTGKGYPLAGT